MCYNILFSMRHFQRSSLKYSKQTNCSVPNLLDHTKTKGSEGKSVKSILDSIQSQLSIQHGYHLSKRSYPILSLYLEEFVFLKSVITRKHQQRMKLNTFVDEYRRYYSGQKVSQLLEETTNKNKEFKKQGTLFRSECLLKYFKFQLLEDDKIVAFVVEKINNAKNRGCIKYEIKKSQHKRTTFFPLIDKQNKSQKKNKLQGSIQTKNNIADRQHRVRYQIISLKMLLEGQHPDPIETNKICEDIKVHLQDLFHTIKLKPMNQEIPMRMSRRVVFTVQ